MAGRSILYRPLYHGYGYHQLPDMDWHLQVYFYTNGNTHLLLHYYQDLYRGINFANSGIEYVPQLSEDGITEAKRSELMAEAHFMRGYYLTWCWKLNWEKLIIRDKYLTDQADLTNPSVWPCICLMELRHRRTEVRNCTFLPPVQVQNWACYLWAAHAYLGFAYLTRAYEESAQETQHLAIDALTALNAVTGYELVSGDALIDMFNGRNKNSQLHRFRWTGRLGWNITQRLPCKRIQKEGKISNNGRYDERIYNTLFFKDEYWNDGTGKIWGYEYDDLHYYWKVDEDGNYLDENNNIIKELEEKGVKDILRPSSFRLHSERIVCKWIKDVTLTFRPICYVNVLLMKAEVLNKQGHPRTNYSYHQRHPCPNTEIYQLWQELHKRRVQVQIEHERIIEFPLESYRWYDLRRWANWPKHWAAKIRGRKAQLLPHSALGNKR